MKELKKQMLEEKIENNLIEDLKEEEIAKYKQNFTETTCLKDHGQLIKYPVKLQ